MKDPLDIFINLFKLFLRIDLWRETTITVARDRHSNHLKCIHFHSNHHNTNKKTRTKTGKKPLISSASIQSTSVVQQTTRFNLSRIFYTWDEWEHIIRFYANMQWLRLLNLLDQNHFLRIVHPLEVKEDQVWFYIWKFVQVFLLLTCICQ